MGLNRKSQVSIIWKNIQIFKINITRSTTKKKKMESNKGKNKRCSFLWSIRTAIAIASGYRTTAKYDKEATADATTVAVAAD
jgi:hypothetical protein